MSMCQKAAITGTSNTFSKLQDRATSQRYQVELRKEKINRKEFDGRIFNVIC